MNLYTAWAVIGGLLFLLALGVIQSLDDAALAQLEQQRVGEAQT